VTTEKHDHEQEQRQHINVRINGTHYKVEGKLLAKGPSTTPKMSPRLICAAGRDRV